MPKTTDTVYAELPEGYHVLNREAVGLMLDKKIPCMLTPGEVVVPPGIARKIGGDKLAAANKEGLKMRGFQDGGEITDDLPTVGLSDSTSVIPQQNPIMAAFNASNASREAARQQFKAAVNPASLTGGAQGSVAAINAPVAPQIQAAPTALPSGVQKIGNSYSQVGKSAADMSGIKSAIGSVTKPAGLNMASSNNQAALANMQARSNPNLANVQKAEAGMAKPAPAPMKQMNVSLGTNSQPQYFANGTLDPKGAQELINRTTGVDKASGGGISRVMLAKEAFAKAPTVEAAPAPVALDPMTAKMTEAAAKPVNIPKPSIAQTMGEHVYQPPVGGWASEAGSAEGGALKAGIGKAAGAVGKYALKPLAGVGALAGIASTATEASPLEAAMKEKYGVEINPIKAKLRQGIQQGEDWATGKISQGAKALASRAADLFTPAVTTTEPNALPVGAPLPGGGKVGSPEGFAAAEKANALPAPQNLGPVGTTPTTEKAIPTSPNLGPVDAMPAAGQEQIPQTLGEVGAGQGMIVGKDGRKSIATKTGIYKYSPSGELISKGTPDKAPTQSAKAQALGTTDFWLNKGYEGGQAQYLAEQKSKQGDTRRQYLENIALNGGPTGDMSPSEFGRAKRQQATAQNLLQQLDAKEAAQAGLGMKQQELGINERRAKASETATAVKEAAAEARENRLEKQGAKTTELAEKEYERKVEAEKNRVQAWTMPDQSEFKGTAQEVPAAKANVTRKMAGAQWEKDNKPRFNESQEAYRTRKISALQKVFPAYNTKTGEPLEIGWDEKYNLFAKNKKGEYEPYTELE
jgi:hypothetical protein